MRSLGRPGGGSAIAGGTETATQATTSSPGDPRCPICHGLVDPSAYWCGYCGARLDGRQLRAPSSPTPITSPWQDTSGFPGHASEMQVDPATVWPAEQFGPVTSVSSTVQGRRGGNARTNATDFAWGGVGTHAIDEEVVFDAGARLYVFDTSGPSADGLDGFHVLVDSFRVVS